MKSEYVASDYEPCREGRECFGTVTYRNQVKCAVLTHTYRFGQKCPFCKPVRTETNGKTYPDKIFDGGK